MHIAFIAATCPGSVVGDILGGFDWGKMVVYPGRLAGRLGTLGARFCPRT
ncbi:hypothetical protein [Lichenifustis flavocetrariae]|uniref:Uncharacterized protein n=1 Tax=Lichenifustis flavocetrariae TaxID=2949735 RepID=A0AA42CM34_9HYPH|nr:hypothetical protein [Lichenifustis flavocetrariae]MCW6512259.1 hypothetical protein [Lichenifustis flavocetrariae]